jgi:hypothetical protein
MQPAEWAAFVITIELRYRRMVRRLFRLRRTALTLHSGLVAGSGSEGNENGVR